MATKKLLAVDDEKDNLDLIARTFDRQFRVYRATDGQAAVKIALEQKPDVIITDQRMPNMTGVQFLTKISAALPNAVRLLVSGYSDYEALVHALNDAKVDRFIEKPLHTRDLQIIVDILLRNAALQAERDEALECLKKNEQNLQKLVDEKTLELVKANQELNELAIRDPLTLLFNRRYLMEQLQIEVARAARFRHPFCLLFFDIDDFKAINDEHGHAAGDEALRELGKKLRDEIIGVRDSDFAARYGGEEFCVILPETNAEGSMIAAERLRKEIASMTLPSSDEIRLTVSVGVAVYPDHGTTVTDLLSAADAAQYSAKKDGKNRVALATRPQF